MILDRSRVAYYLALAQEIGRTRPLHDVHVSPYEVIFCAFDYRPDPENPGVYALDDAPYRPPRSGPLRIRDAASEDRVARRAAVPRALSTMMLRQQYAHLGPRVLSDHMALCGMDRCLLLPVRRPGSAPDEQARLMFDLYGGDPRFDLAYCPQVPESEAAAVAELRGAAAAHRIRAVKVHPNIQGLDLSTRRGRTALEHLLAACGATDLPLMVHGGISRLLEDPAGSAFAALENLASVPWRAAGVPVVICHAGLFGCSPSEVEARLPVLGRLLARNDNVAVDLSGLGFTPLCAVLGRIDPQRIVFGSDALYFPQWSAVVKVLHALEHLGMPVEETFGLVAGSNPERHLFRRLLRRRRPPSQQAPPTGEERP